MKYTTICEICFFILAGVLITMPVSATDNKEMESMQQAVEDMRQKYRATPRIKTVSHTGSAVYSKYIASWGKRIERVGEVNYPEIAMNMKQARKVLVKVGINADGSLKDIKIAKSSGLPELDKSVERIVKLAAPFEPLPEKIRQETDVLYIVRQWSFMPGNKKGEERGR